MNITNIKNKQNLKHIQLILIGLVSLVSFVPTFFSAIVTAQSNIPLSSTTSASSTSTNNLGSPLPVTGTGTAGNTISVVFPDGTTAKTTIKADGTYVIYPLVSQIAGNIIVTELTPAGLIAVAAKTIPYAGGVVTPVAKTPKLSITDPYICPGIISGTVDNALSTVTIEISKSGVVLLSIPAQVKSDGSWTINIANKLPDGSYTNKYTATYNGMIASGSYDFMHKNICSTTPSASTIRTGGLNAFAAINTLILSIFSICFILINKFIK
jgi:hypothetical protein